MRGLWFGNRGSAVPMDPPVTVGRGAALGRRPGRQLDDARVEHAQADGNGFQARERHQSVRFSQPGNIQVCFLSDLPYRLATG